MALAAMGLSLAGNAGDNKQFAMYMTLVAMGVSAAVCIVEGVETKGISVEDEEIIAKVNGNVIYKGDYESFYKERLSAMGVNEETKKFLDAQEAALIEKLIEREVLLQKAEEMKITCTDQELQEVFNAIKAQCGEEIFSESLRLANMTEEEYLNEIKKKIVISKVEAAVRDIEVEVTDEEIATYYETNKSDYTIAVGANMSYILVYSEKKGGEAALQVELSVKEIQDKLSSGVTFEALAEECKAKDEENVLYAIEDLGFVEYDKINLDDNFIESIKALSEGEVSQPIKSENGYYFIKVENISEQEVISIEEAESQISEKIKEDKKQAYSKEQLSKWMEEAEIEKY